MTPREYQHQRSEEQRLELEQRNLERYGLRYVSLPLPTQRTYPKPDFSKTYPFPWHCFQGKTRWDLDREEEAAYRLKYPTP